MAQEILTLEELKKEVEKVLINMSCTDILFPDPQDKLLVATFNCKELISFKANLPGWNYSGIHLDPTKNRGYKIDFQKID